MTSKLRFIPLGGLGEVGMNCSVLDCGATVIMIDCGIGFTNVEGAETMHPDFGWLEGRKVDAIFITHGHEDHIGALPFLLRSVKAPVYAPPYAAALIEDRLSEHVSIAADIRPSPAGSHVAIGEIGVERFAVHHSIADATGLIVHTREGTIVHTGDFKIEKRPTAGQRFDEDRLREVGDTGVRLLLSDSTGADANDRSNLESDAEESLRAAVDEAEHRVVVSTFSSNLFRLRAALGIARHCGRKVCLIGRSVHRHTETALTLGMLPALDDLLLSPEAAAQLPREKIMIIAAGTQGEHRSALTRLARDEHRGIHLQRGDTVILSSRAIPGNELAVFDVVDRFKRRGLHVITRETHPAIHASGHAGRDEQREMLRLLRPGAFVPVHGTYHLMHCHAQLAHEEAVDEVMVIENGTVLDISSNGLDIAGTVPVGRIHLDSDEAIAASVVRERRTMGIAGVVTVAVAVRSGRLKRFPRVISRGVFDPSKRDQAERTVAQYLRGKLQGRRFSSLEAAEEAVTHATRRFLSNHFRKHPLLAVVAGEEG